MGHKLQFDKHSLQGTFLWLQLVSSCMFLENKDDYKEMDGEVGR